MRLMETLQAYLMDSGQVDALAVRQAQLACRPVADEDLKDESAAVTLLVLAALRKGSPRPDRDFLLAPLQAETVRGFAEARRAEDPAPSWESVFTDPARCGPYAAALERLLREPSRLAPLTGTVPAESGAPWPLLVVDPASRTAGFSRYWNAALALDTRVAGILHEPLSTVDKATAAQALKEVFEDQTILRDNARFHSRQIAAAALALRARFMVLSGGPGTGKTSVVLQVLRTLLRVYPHIQPDRIVLCAPTGRAKARLGQSVDNGLDELRKRGSAGGGPVQARDQGLRTCLRKTVYSLLGFGADGRPRYNRRNPLPYQVIVVDEASMVDLCSFAALLEAASPACRIILSGDMHQLPSVEAGAVLGDLTERFGDLAAEGYPTCGPECARWVAGVTKALAVDSGTGVPERTLVLSAPDGRARAGALADHTMILTHSYRSTREIVDLSALVNAGDSGAALAFIAGLGDRAAVGLAEGPASGEVTRWLAEHYTPEVIRELRALRGAEITGDESGRDLAAVAAAAQRVLAASCILTLVHHGPCGRVTVSSLADKLLRPQLDKEGRGRFFHGQPVILGANHHDLDLYNGDMGLVVRARDNSLRAVFPRAGTCSVQALDRLYGLESAFAMTVHKAQGSEFDRVLLVLPQDRSPLLSRQILYTALTRARQRVRILGTGALLAHAISVREKRPGGVSIR